MTKLTEKKTCVVKVFPLCSVCFLLRLARFVTSRTCASTLWQPLLAMWTRSKHGRRSPTICCSESTNLIVSCGSDLVRTLESVLWCPNWMGGRAHYVMVSKIQWKPFWLATQLDPQNDWTGLHMVWTMMHAHRPSLSSGFRGPHTVYLFFCSIESLTYLSSHG